MAYLDGPVCRPRRRLVLMRKTIPCKRACYSGPVFIRGVSAVVVVLVVLLRSMSDGVAILTVAMVMGREVVTRKSATANNS